MKRIKSLSSPGKQAKQGILCLILAFQYGLKKIPKLIYSGQWSTPPTGQSQASYSSLSDFNHSYPLALFPPHSAASIHLAMQLMITVIPRHTGKWAPVPTIFPADTVLQSC